MSQSQHIHQENSKLLIFYLICLNPLNLKLSKIREEKRRGLDLFFLMFLSKRVSIATPELQSFGDSEMGFVNGHGFNFDVAPSLVGIWCPLISKVGDVGDVGGVGGSE